MKLRWVRLVRRFNVIALALFLTWALVMAAGSTFSLLRESSGDRAPAEAPVQAEVIDTPGGKISIYSSHSPKDREALRDVRFVAMKTGKVVKVDEDANALIYGAESIEGLGHVALVKTGMRGDRPKFDFVFIRFPGLQRFIIARDIDSLDATQVLDDRTFSAVIWDDLEDARFIIVDATTGAIQENRELDFSQSGKNAETIPGSVAVNGDAPSAPINKFH